MVDAPNACSCAHGGPYWERVGLAHRELTHHLEETMRARQADVMDGIGELAVAAAGGGAGGVVEPAAAAAAAAGGGSGAANRAL